MICFNNIREYFDQIYKKQLDEITPDGINEEINDLINHNFMNGEALNHLIHDNDDFELEEIFNYVKKTYKNIKPSKRIKMLKSIYPYDINYKELKTYDFNLQFDCFSSSELAELINIEKEFYLFNTNRENSLRELIQDIKLEVPSKEKEVAKLLKIEKLDFDEVIKNHKAIITQKDIYRFDSNYLNLTMNEKEQMINKILELNPCLFRLDDLSNLFNMITTYIFEKLNITYDKNNIDYVNNNIIYKSQHNKYLLLNIDKLDCQIRELINNDKFSNVRELYFNYVVSILEDNLKDKILEVTNGNNLKRKTS